VQRVTRQRAEILELLKDSTQFLSAQQIHQLLTEQDHPIALATVYRALQALTGTGGLDVRLSPDGEHLYRRCARSDAHHHLLCRSCGTAVDVPGLPLEQWVDHLARAHGFTQVRTTVELDGVCSSCSLPDR
jgi:Fur family transcriptional regulator, ferric uptake regulator